MESRSGEHGRGSLKPLPPWTPTPAGHSFSLGAAGGCFPWPPQMRSPAPLSSSSSYTCGYCRREFRSAQALGGHMNVHRRDRARLRQCCSAAAAASSSSLSSPGMVAAHQQHGRAPPPPLPSLNFSPTRRAGGGTDPAVVYSFFSAATAALEVDVAASKAAIEVSLELGIGVCGSGSGGGGGGGGVEEDGLDLELRLGCAWE